MPVQRSEWASQDLSEVQQQQQQHSSEEHNDRTQLGSDHIDFARPETPVTSQLPDFPRPKSYLASPNVPRMSPRDNVRNVNQTPVRPIMHRRRSSSSFSSVSIITNALSSGLANAHPAPAYVGPFGATQAVSEYQARLKLNSKKEEDTSTVPSTKEDVTFTLPALALLNGFLDQLLFNFLAHAQSTGLAELRPAVSDVLRPRLAGEAIASAEEELHELLGGRSEEDEERKIPNGDDDWDLELVWKRTRLRVMVYIRLGDMEDDDEERYVREGEHPQAGVQRFSQSTGLVSWAAAIFLTSVLEYVAEQVLQVAGQIAIDRARATALNSATLTKSEKHLDDLTVEDTDMERVALNSGLSRLWRNWRKAQRNNAGATNSPQTPSTLHTRRQGSIGNATGSIVSPRRSSFNTALESAGSRRESLDTARETLDKERDEVPDADHPEYVIASNIPLPLTSDKRDIDEIEVPGLARDPDELETISETDRPTDTRRRSFSGHPHPWQPAIAFGQVTTDRLAMNAPEKPPLKRQRSSSVPITSRTSANGKGDTKTAAERITEHGIESIAEGRKNQSHEVLDDLVAKTTTASTATSATNSHNAQPTEDSNQVREQDEAAFSSLNGESTDHAVSPHVHGAVSPDNPSKSAHDSITEPHDKSVNGINSDAEMQASDHEHLDAHSALRDPEVTQISDIPRTPSESNKTAWQQADNVRDLASKNITPPRSSGQIPEDSSSVTFASPVSQVSSLGQRDGQVSPTLASDSVETYASSDSPHSVQPERHRTPSPNEQNRFPTPISSGRYSTLDSGLYPVVAEPLSFRPAPALVSERNNQWVPSSKISPVPESSSTVQEHPVVQRIASLKKGNEFRYKDEDNTQPLTSASIKGPEDFDMFVQGGDTVKYTLTPENVRDEPASIGPYHASSPTSAALPVESRTIRNSIIKQAVRGIPDPIAESVPSGMLLNHGERSASRPYTYNTSVGRRSGLMAREPRVMTVSTRDIADFIRSTGPDREQQPVNLLATKSSSALPAHKPDSTVPVRAGSFGGISSKGLVQSGRQPPVPPLPAGRSKTSMQPRAATSVSGGSAELIDFIRNGPSQAREHRISRTVAPFRTTMDSEQLNDWSDQFLSQPDLVLATGSANTMHKQSISSVWSSNQASANSRSALIVNGEMSLQTKASSSKINDGDPLRKSYRNKDPYALPSDDDDDDDDFIMNHMPRRNEESMVEFLRNTDPSVGNAPQPISQVNGIARQGSVKTGAGTVDVLTTNRSKSVPGLKITTTARTQGIRAPASAGPRVKLEARSPGTPIRDPNHDSAIHNTTGDLADFLRNSGPSDINVHRDPFATLPSVVTSAARLSKPQPIPKVEKDRSGRRSIFGNSLFGRGGKKV